MSELYLCEKPLAQTPYYLDDASLNIYSLEELCYYLLQNVILLDRKFMSPGLCSWIGEACGYKNLQDRLNRKIREGCSLAEFAAEILSETDYCSRREIDEMKMTLHQLEEKSDFERSKIRADKLMENERYIYSIYEYKRILKMRTAKEQNAVMLGSVWQNLGCAYAGMLLFEEAEECFAQAYALNERKNSLRSLLLSILCQKDEEHFAETCRKYYVDERSVDYLRSEYRKAVNTEETKAFRENLDRIEAEMESGTGPKRRKFQTEAGDIIKEWKEQYRNYCRI